MKKLFKILITLILVVTTAFTVIGCNGGGNGATGEKGVFCKKDSKTGTYILYDYVADGTTTSLDVASAVTNKYGKDAIVGSIKKGAFSGDNSLTEIIVPDTVTEIAGGAFEKMRKLEKITLPFIGRTANSDAYIGESYKENEEDCINEERIFCYIFGTEEYEDSSKITANYGAATVDYYLPANFESVSVGSNKEGAELYSIPAYAFNGLSILLNVKLLDNIDAIGEYAFGNCSALGSVNISKNVKTIYNNAFEGCAQLKTGLTFDEGATLETIKDKAFYKTEIKNLVLPSSVKTIGNSAFSLSKLESITLPSSLEKIGAFAFAGCESLVTVNVSAVPTTSQFVIENGAFDGCEKFDKVVFDEFKSATIDATAFNGTK